MVPVVDGATIGAQIRALRERFGLQSRELAQYLGIDPSAMSNIESGKRAVKTEELGAIAAALHVSPLAILDPSSLLARLPVAPRSAAGAVIASTAVNRLTALTELHQVLADTGIPAEPRLGDVPVVDENEWKDSADTLAAWANAQLVPTEGDERFSALSEAIEETFRVDILVEEHVEDTLAGASITDRSFPLIFINATYPTARSLFTLAHELAHVLSGQGDVLTLDRNLTAHSNRERFANAFAAAFLMPEADVRKQIDKDGRTSLALAHMVARFGVSFESLVYRLHNLRMINAQGRDQLQTWGLRGVLAQVDDEDLVRTLLSRLGSKPERRPPEWLTVRAFGGYRAGVLSVKPLAELLDVPHEELLGRMALMEKDAVEIVNQNYPEEDPRTSDEELFGGSPV